MEPNLGGRISGLDARLANYAEEERSLLARIANPATSPEKTARRRQRLAYLKSIVVPRTVHELQRAPQ